MKNLAQANDTLTDTWLKAGFLPPTFTRTELAKLLNCTPLTIANREKKNQYPEPKRSSTSNHRLYTIQDVFILQYLTNNQINLSSVASLLWDKGYKRSNNVLPCLESEVAVFKKNIPAESAHQVIIDG